MTIGVSPEGRELRAERFEHLGFDRRVEVVTPIEDRRLHPRVCSLLETCLADNRQAWDLRPDGTYEQRKPGAGPVRSTHEILLQNSWGIPALPPGSENGQQAGAPVDLRSDYTGHLG